MFLKSGIIIKNLNFANNAEVFLFHHPYLKFISWVEVGPIQKPKNNLIIRRYSNDTQNIYEIVFKIP